MAKDTQGKEAAKGTVSLWQFGLLLVAVLALVVGGRLYMASQGGTIDKYGEVTSNVIGGPFTMVKHDGSPVTQADFKGKYQLYYFGYTFCPDVCPTGLSNISDALMSIPEESKQVQAIFVSVDPGRDTPEVMADFVSNFEMGANELVGLTGSEEQVAAMAKAYKAFYRLEKDEGSAADYLVSHSSFIYVMDKEGNYITNFTHTTPPADMAKALKELVAR